MKQRPVSGWNHIHQLYLWQIFGGFGDRLSRVLVVVQFAGIVGAAAADDHIGKDAILAVCFFASRPMMD